MSRTLSHVRYKHWNITEPRWYSGRQLDEHAVGKELYDLRFYAGCKRVPQWIHRRQDDFGYVRTWGHANGVAHAYAKEMAGMYRAAVRAYSRDIVKAHRSGGDLDDYLEPEGRTRHRALWEAW